MEDVKKYPEYALGRIQGTMWTSALSDKDKLKQIREAIDDWHENRG